MQAFRAHALGGVIRNLLLQGEVRLRGGERAVAAQHHAAVQTSTYSQQRSASVCRAFVAEVVELGRKTYRPPVPRTAAYQDFDAAAMYLC